MTIVVYECDTCNRTIERQQNPHGLDFIGRCVITDGCKGDLHLQRVKQAHNIPVIPTVVDGLNDWIQRNVLFTHSQTISSDTWRIKHNLGSEPATQIFVDVFQGDGSTIQEEILPESITVVNSNEIEVALSERHTGTAQCLARSSAVGQTVEYVKVEPPAPAELIPIQMSVNRKITLAVNTQDTNLDARLHFISPTTRSEEDIRVTFDTLNNDFNPWDDASQVLIEGKLFNVMVAVVTFEELNDKGIEDGSAMYITFDDGSELLEKSVILLTNEPFDSIDKEFETFLELSTSNAANAAFTMQYRDQEFYGYNTISQKTYPPIKITR
jgi:hypothetical protein